MAIRDWPADTRPREKLLRQGVGALTDAELVAVFLRTGVKGKSEVDLGRELLDRFGGLSGLAARIKSLLVRRQVWAKPNTRSCKR